MLNLSSNFEEKIEYIIKSNNESCVYLTNIYKTYYKKNNIDYANINDYLEINKCLCSENIINTLEQYNEKNFLFLCFTNKLEKRHEEIYRFCKNKNIKLLFVTIDNNFTYVPYINYKKLNINRVLKKAQCKSVFIDINIDDINYWYNFDLNLIHNFENIFKVFDRYSIEEIKKAPEETAYKSITNNTKIKYKRSRNKFDLITIINKFMKYKKTSNVLGLNIGDKKIIANIFINRLNQTNYYLTRELSELINILSYTDKYQMYSHIYELLCNNLEKDIENYSYCIFKDNKCIAQRDKLNTNNWPKNECNGCCHDVGKNTACQYLDYKKCNISCISCRLFTCRYLKDRGIDYNIRKNIHAKCFFNFLQIPVLIWNFYTPKSEIINKLYKYNKHLR